MSQSNSIEEDAYRRNYSKPYGGKHPIPTIQGYREHRKEIEKQYGSREEAQDDAEDDSRTRRAYDSAKTILKGQDDTSSSSQDPYPVANLNDEERQRKSSAERDDNIRQSQTSKHNDKSATEQAAGAVDPKDKRKAMKKHKPGGGREVTDPVTHLPIVIYDKTEKDLNNAPENEPAPGSHPRTATGLSNKSKTREQLDDERQEIQRSYNGLQKTFPPPSFKDVEEELASVYKLALTVGLSAVVGLAAIAVIATRLLHSAGVLLSTFILAIVVGSGAFLTYSIRGWVEKKVRGVWEDETWEALREEEAETLNSDAELPESVHWLNSILSSVWPLINPDLFSSLVDMLEDVMQASLPKVVRMVSIDDMGQGSESIRILGIKWLPTGAASQSVDDDGNLKPTNSNEKTDRTAPGEGQQDPSAGDGEVRNKLQQPDDNKSSEAEKKQQEQTEEAMRAGMEAEEGDFVNVEMAFAYRARSSGKSIKSKAKNAHLYLKFYLPGGVVLPVWVELRGIMGVMRARLQLTPDPPFFSVCTFTFLGQPKADLSCVPLSKHSLNIMDVPLISGFVQSAIDAALAEYVAPKSMTIDLKDMLMGEDYKKDTNTRGVVWIFIKMARDFKQGDGGIGPFEGSSDAYVTVSWGKFGKPVASTRIITGEQAPNWHEWASILVSPDELNANERLRLQLWDSDKWTADDDLGRVEVDLHELMNDPKTKNKIHDREDRFKAVDLEEEMPGTLTWSVGYFEKTRITDQQLQQQNFKEDIRNKDQLKDFVSKLSERKLREANLESGHDDELHQQKVQDYKEQEDNMIISAPPSKEHVCGILSMQIHNITGLEVSKQNKADEDEGDHPDTESGTEGQLPDSYCTIIMNHTKIYKTRTKPRNGKPFFNAGTERFVRDWTTTEIIISVRDSREKENDALLGVIYLPLRKLFEHRSQFMETFPLVGGVGYGRARISMVWRSVELQLSPNLRGWDYGTLEINNSIRTKGQPQNDLEGDRLKLRTNLSKVKMTFNDGKWSAKRRRRREDDDSVFLPVRKRYASALIIEFRKSKIGPDKTPGFCVLWLSELTDNEEQTKTLTIFKGGKKNLARAESCCDYKAMEDDDQKLGEIELTLRFWNGLSGYHKSHAEKSKNTDVRNVMECLDTINDEDMGDLYSDLSDSNSDSDTETENANGIGRTRSGTDSSKEEATRKKLRTNTNKTSNSDDDDSGVESNEDNGFAKIKAPLTKVQDIASKVTDKLVGDQNLESDGSRGLRGQAADYKKNHKELHRKHRGVMQWKGVRTLDWAGGKAKRAKSKVGELFEHGEKDQGIETEV